MAHETNCSRAAKYSPENFQTSLGAVARWKRVTVWATLIAFVGHPLGALAQVVAAPDAAAQNRPSVGNAPNGIPMVQIAAPSAAGVSRNQYQEFNVAPGGLILNNSQALTRTQLGGYVEGNPNLAGGMAKIILNEVTSTSASSLRGHTEVAGGRAELVIANPNGITCDGCGFINTSRTVLTTGVPLMGAGGSLDGFRVANGQVFVQGAGLHGSEVDQLDIISRAVSINAEIQANNLNIIAGANRVDYASLDTQALPAQGNAPSVAIDVGALGGMYANRIRLVGTEGGVGVRSLGAIVTRIDDIHISSGGDLSLAGKTSSAGHLTLQSDQDISNSGSIYGKGNVFLVAASGITNTSIPSPASSATVAAGGNLMFQSASLVSSGIIASGINSDGTTVASSAGAGGGGSAGSGNLSINVQDFNNSGKVTAGGDLLISAKNLNSSGSLVAGRSLTAEAENLTNQGMVASLGDMNILLTETLENSGHILSGGKGSFYLKKLKNLFNASIWSDGDLTIGRDDQGTRAELVSNDRASIESQQGDIRIRAQEFKNLGADPSPYITTSSVHEYLGQAWRFPAYSAEVARAPGFYEEWVKYVPSLVQYKDWLPYTSTDKRVNFEVTGYIQSLSSSFVPSPGKIHSGQDLFLDVGSGTNLFSDITAVGNITLSGNSFSNIGSALVSVVNIQPGYSNGDATKSGSNGLGHWPSPNNYLPLLSSTQYRTGTLSIIGAGKTFSATGLQSFTNSNGTTSNAYIGTSSSAPNNPAGTLHVSGLPSGGLLVLAPNANSNYLIERNPLFADRGIFLSSDYFLSRLSLDPSKVEKRLGDGFYEQRLVREQITQLTGRPYLHASNSEDDYRRLLDNAVRYAETYHLTPGIALSAAQMAALTDDIVWLEERVVAGQRVLVPQLYLAPNSTARIAATGGVVSANAIQLAANTVTNSGTLDAKAGLGILANDIVNQNGVIRGNDTLLVANNTLTSQGGNISGDTVTLSAGTDLNLNAATVKAKSALELSAGRDLTLGTITEHYANSGRQGQGYDQNWNVSGTIEHLTSVSSSGTLKIQAGRDLTSRGASISAEGNGWLEAGRNLTLDAVAEQHQSHVDQRKGSWRRSETTVDHRDTTHIGSSVSVGGSLGVSAGGDVMVRGSTLVAQKDLSVMADGNLTLASVQDTQTDSFKHKESKTGFFSTGGIGFSVGTQKQENQRNGSSVTQVGSLLGSVEGDVVLYAGERYRQTASNVTAPGGDIAISAKQVDIESAQNLNQEQVGYKTSFSGVTVSVTNPVISAIQTAQQMQKQAGKVEDPRLQALAAANVALAARNAAKAVVDGQGQVRTGGINPDGTPATKEGNLADKAGGFNLSVSIGSSKSQSSSTVTSSTAVGSEIAAKGDISITARGEGKEDGATQGGLSGDITVAGSRIQAGGNVDLTAADKIKLLASRNDSASQSLNKGSSGSIGAGFNLGAGGGFSVNAAASKSQGNSNGSDLTWSESRIEGGETVRVKSGSDTNLRGAIVEGKQVIADVGGNLAIESLQDQSTYDSKRSNSGFSVSVPVTGGSFSGSISSGGSKIESNYKSVVEQSGFKAGDNGFLVVVGGNTDLKGGVITSTDKAVEGSKNSFNTEGALTLANLDNKADYKGTGSSFNIGAGISMDGKLAPGGTGAGVGKEEGSASSTTQSGISGIAGNKDVRTGDGSNGIGKIFDAQKVQDSIDAQIQITQMFGQQASKAIGDYAKERTDEAKVLREQAKQESNDERVKELTRRAQELEDQWGDHGTMRLAAHTLVGGLTGGPGGAGGAAVGTLTAPAVAEALEKAGIGGPLASTLTAIASTAAGAVVGGSSGAGAALNEVSNNYLTHKEIVAKEKEKLAQCAPADANCRKSIEEKYATISKARDLAHESCSSPEACRTARAEIEADMAELAARARELSDLSYAGKLTTSQTQEALTVAMNLRDASNSYEQVWRQFRQVTSLGEWTSAEHQKTFADVLTVLGGLGASGAIGKVNPSEKLQIGGKPITFDGIFYSVDGLKFSKSYYERLWKEGRPAPFLQAKEILNGNPKISPDPRGYPGYFKYEGGGLEMIYNPKTGQVGHIQPARSK